MPKYRSLPSLAKRSSTAGYLSEEVDSVPTEYDSDLDGIELASAAPETEQLNSTEESGDADRSP